MSNSSWKELFPIEDDITYLNTASIGLMPKRTVALAREIIEKKSRGGAKYFSIKDLDENLERLCHRTSKLFHCDSDEVAFPFNTAGGIATVLTGMDWNPGDAIIVTDQEFPTNLYPYQVAARKFKLDLRIVKAKDGRLPPKLIEEYLDEKVRLIALSYVQFGSGYRADLREIAKLAHENDGFLLVDGIQGLGALDLDVHSTNVDFVTSGSYKWLIGPFNTGVFYCRKDLVILLDPLTIGWMADENYMNMAYHEFVPASTARRFQASLMPPLNAMSESLDVLTSIGIKNIERHIMAVLDYFIHRIQEEFDHQVQVLSSLDSNERSGIIVFSLPEAATFVESLASANIYVALRKGNVRVSVHLYNDESDIDRLVEAISQHLKAIGV